MATKVIYTTDYGALRLSSAFVHAMFKKYPPESPEGLTLWQPSSAAYIPQLPSGDEFAPGYARVMSTDGRRFTDYVRNVGSGVLYYVGGEVAPQWRDVPCITAEFGCAKCLSKVNGKLRMTHVPEGAEYQYQIVSTHDGPHEIVVVNIDADAVMKDLINVARSVAAGPPTHVMSPVTAKVVTAGSLAAAQADLNKTRAALDAAFKQGPCPGTCYRWAPKT